jgi:hypothetical protein
MAVFTLRAVEGGVVALTAVPMTEEHQVDTVTMPLPVVQDPRYGGQQMA